MPLTRSQIIIIGAIGLIVLFFILIFLGVIPGLREQGGGGFGQIGGGEQTVLNFWGVIDNRNDKTAIESIIEEYQKINKNIQINFRSFNDKVIYEETLINALAIGQAPDILMFDNNWLSKHRDKVLPLQEISLPLSQFRQLFPKVAEQDFIIKEQEKPSIIYALPLYIDTLALLYNKDIFDAKAIALPPTNWQGFRNLITYLTEKNLANQITKAGAAIGGSEKNINAASDLLNLLMLQFGSKMTDERGKTQFGKEGLEALNFYLQFSNPNSPYHAWNENLRYSLDSFSGGQTAIIFNYASNIPLIKEKNPFLRIGVSPMLQLPLTDQPINYANYWGLSVSNQSRRPDLAWDFVFFATTNPQIAEIFIQTTKKPPALRELISKYTNDAELGVFSRQALTARSWPQPDEKSVKKIFSDMIELILKGRLSPLEALEKAENEINNL